MTPEERFKRAQALKADISAMIRHRSEVLAKSPAPDKQYGLIVYKIGGSAQTSLDPAFMPIEADHIIEMYIRNVDKQIDQLEVEFETILS